MVETQIPTIKYGVLEQPIHTNAQYLLMRAGLGNKIYSTKEFIDAIESVSLETITKASCRKDVETQRYALKIFAKIDDSITLKNFYPDREKLEAFVNTTFEEMHNALHSTM